MDIAVFCLEMLALGVGVGVISGALGLGGGIIMVPVFLEFVPQMDPHTAKGTSLFAIVFVSAINAWRQNQRHPDKQWRQAAVLASGSIVGGYLGGWVTEFMSGDTVIWIFVALMAILAVRTFLLKPQPVAEADVRRRNALAITIGLGSGLLSGLSGVGGGTIMVPMALMAGIVSNERVVGLSNTVMVATCIASSLAHFLAQQYYTQPWTIGQVSIPLALLVVLGAQAGSPLGRHINTRLTLSRRQTVMGVLLLVIAARMAYRALQ